MSVITVTPNAALDVTYFVRGFRAGGVYRALSVAKKAGGKGLNVARAVRTLGGDPLATGFAGGPTGERILEGLSLEGIRARFVRTAGESRCTIAIVDEETGVVTEIREAGEAVSGEELAEFLSSFGDICRSAVSRSETGSGAGSWEAVRVCEPQTASCLDEPSRAGAPAGRPVVVFSGSLRPGLAPDFYAKLIELAKGCGLLTILDTSGDALKSGVAAGPFLVKPNLTEAQELFGVEHGTPGDGEETDLTRAAAALASRIASYGPQVVVLSMGKHGAVMHHEGRTWSARVRIDDVRNPVGSGDSMVGGMAWALARGQDIVEAFRLGVACGAANALTATAGEFRTEDVTALLEQVEVRSYGSCKP
ncbi:MAG TPA: 1-phosphofructokinase family hexose kinase [Firmicutes bacterium]|nr:1-phosphofructokinase family hexose kinase [Candidatus Fermentithermobacillaceae bacterium]